MFLLVGLVIRQIRPSLERIQRGRGEHVPHWNSQCTRTKNLGASATGRRHRVMMMTRALPTSAGILVLHPKVRAMRVVVGELERILYKKQNKIN